MANRVLMMQGSTVPIERNHLFSQSGSRFNNKSGLAHIHPRPRNHQETFLRPTTSIVCGAIQEIDNIWKINKLRN